MATIEQMREGELKSDQLEIGKVYRVEQYGRPNIETPHKLLDKSLAMFDGRDKFHYMKFTIVAPGTSASRKGQDIYTLFISKPTHSYHFRFFQTAKDRIMQFEQSALQSIIEKRLDKTSAYGVTKDLLALSKKPTKKSGGRKYKTRQTKIQSKKNKTKKNAW